jgi:selenocysteine lyase/cysteine desulfurase
MLGMGAAVDYAADVGIDWIQSRVQGLAKLMRDRLLEVGGVEVWDLGNSILPHTRCGIVTFGKDNTSAGRMKQHLESQGIFISMTDSKANTPTDASIRCIPNLCRASVHYYNTEDEIRKVCDAVMACPPDLS